jgi:hypothetical protein
MLAWCICPSLNPLSVKHVTKNEVSREAVCLFTEKK